MHTRKTLNLSRWLLPGLALCIFALMFYRQLGVHAFNDWDEAIYAQVAKESFINGNQLSFTYGGNVWLEKPPLMIWLIELGYRVFGVNEFGGRFFIPLFALGTILLTYLLAKELFKSPGAAGLAVFVYFLFFQFLFLAGKLQLDIPVGFFILFSVYCLAKVRDTSRWYDGFWLGLAGGVLIKSVIGLLPGLILIAVSLMDKNFSYLKDKNFYRGFLVFLLLTAPWHLMESFKYGRAFWHSYFFYHVLARYASALENHGRDFGFYWRILTEQSLLLAGLIMLACGYFAFRLAKPGYRVVLISALVIFLLFSFSRTKLYGYLLPLYPFLACLIGVTIHDLFSLPKRPIFFYSSLILICSSFLFLGWQQAKFSYLSLGTLNPYDDNREVGRFLTSRIPQKPVYASPEAPPSPSLNFYLGQPARPLSNVDVSQAKLIFHTRTLNVYETPTDVYLKPTASGY